jgi:hypothetical protein
VVHAAPLAFLNNDHGLPLLAFTKSTCPDVIISGLEHTPCAVFEPRSWTPTENTTRTHPPFRGSRKATARAYALAAARFSQTYSDVVPRACPRSVESLSASFEPKATPTMVTHIQRSCNSQHDPHYFPIQYYIVSGHRLPYLRHQQELNREAPVAPPAAQRRPPRRGVRSHARRHLPLPLRGGRW